MFVNVSKLIVNFMKRILVPLLIVLSTYSVAVANAASSVDSLMPVPREVAVNKGKLRVDKSFRVAVEGNPDERIYGAASRFLRRLDNRTGLFLPQDYITSDSSVEDAKLVVSVSRPGKVELGEDESYRLNVGKNAVRIEADTDLGAMHGMETLLQLLSADADGFYFPCVQIQDTPRFAWRGLMIDSARHFMPMDMLKRNLDGMAAVKLNVMHWHLTEDQGFRVESKSYPLLTELGSDGMFYTHEDIREIVDYAADRGIRVYPEFDVPGHATAWLVGHPELGSKPGPYTIERGWGIFQPTLDPTNEKVYQVLEAVFTEMAALFPDEYFHIGGDEVEGHHWEENEGIQAFMKERGISGKEGLQAHFNKRILDILTRLDKKMIGWDEILQPEMPKNIVIHSWRGRDAMVAAAKDGYQSILSNGYYIDLMHPASKHYANDPLPEDMELSDEERSRVLGGEATMWSEHVTVETVDSRIWPRTAAIAERLWSSGSVNDIDDMYRRLDTISLQLEELGLTHLKNREMMMRRLARGFEYRPIEVLADVVEPLKVYRRNSDLSYRSFSPYTLLPDVAVADAKDARLFAKAVDRYFDGQEERRVEAMLERWRDNHEKLSKLARKAPAIREALPLSEALKELSELALRSLGGETLSEDEVSVALAKAREPVAKVELQVVDSIERLLKR